MQIGGRIQNLLMGVAGQFKGIRPFLSGDRRHLHEADFAGSPSDRRVEAAFLPDHGLHQRGRQSIVLGDSSDLRIETIFITRQPEPEDGSTADQEQQDDRPPFQGLVRPEDSH